MEGKSSLPPPTVISPTLDIGRAYNAKEAAAILGITPYVLNERVRKGSIKPMFETGDRRYSGYALAQLLGWPVADKVRLEMPSKDPVATGVGIGSRSGSRGRVSRNFSAAVAADALPFR